MTKLMGHEFSITCFFIELGGIGMPKGVQTTGLESSAFQELVKPLPEGFFSQGTVTIMQNESIVASRLSGLQFLDDGNGIGTQLEQSITCGGLGGGNGSVSLACGRAVLVSDLRIDGVAVDLYGAVFVVEVTIPQCHGFTTTNARVQHEQEECSLLWNVEGTFYLVTATRSERNPIAMFNGVLALVNFLVRENMNSSMLMLVTYDVNATTPAGAKRLRQVAKLCEKYGIRVQNSVFEVLVDGAQLVKLKAKLSELIDEDEDSVRLYRMGNSYGYQIETMGRVPLIQTGGPMIL